MSAAAIADTSKHRGDTNIVEPTHGREPLVRGTHTFHDITEIVCRVNETELK